MDLTSNERRFFSLFQGTSSKEEAQTSVPEELKLKLVGSASEAPELPRVGETEAEKEAKEEDMARRAAYLAAQAEAQASVVPNPAQQEAHDRYVRIFGDVRQKA